MSGPVVYTSLRAAIGFAHTLATAMPMKVMPYTLRKFTMCPSGPRRESGLCVSILEMQKLSARSENPTVVKRSPKKRKVMVILGSTLQMVFS